MGFPAFLGISHFLSLNLSFLVCEVSVLSAFERHRYNACWVACIKCLLSANNR